ncbi:MAG: hypothetical protein M1832_001798 [Thelocarpon impressellum]|nr:MAG: hypothetical protein M1832_001798 [Thelocarpon impressellum]
MSDPIVSHGRGGAGNIGHDATQYVDGEITREGHPHESGDGPVSTGRGGTGNITGVGTAAANPRPSTEHVPPSAVRHSADENFHVGRGGQGNAHHAEKPGANGTAGVTHQGLADKLKNKLFKSKAKEPVT